MIIIEPAEMDGIAGVTFALPAFCCAVCGTPIRGAGSYGWRKQGGHSVSMWHRQCQPESGWHTVPLSKLPALLARSLGKQKSGGVKTRVLQKARAAAIADQPVEEYLQAEAELERQGKTSETRAEAAPIPRAPDASLGVPQQPPEPRILEPEIPRGAAAREPSGVVMPCGFVVREGATPWISESKQVCGQPSSPGRVYCSEHDQQIFGNATVTRLLNGRRR